MADCDFLINQGADWAQSWQEQNSDGTFMDLDGYGARLIGKQYRGATEYLFDFTAGDASGVLVIDTANRIVRWRVPGATTATYGPLPFASCLPVQGGGEAVLMGVGELLLISPGGQISRELDSDLYISVSV